MSSDDNFHQFRNLRIVLGLFYALVGWMAVSDHPCGFLGAQVCSAEEVTADWEFPRLTPPPPEAEQSAGEMPLTAGPQTPASLGQTVAEDVENNYVFQDSRLQAFGENYEDFKKRHHLPITLSAWNWWHVNTGGPLSSGYGIPSTSNPNYPVLNGTYYYSLETSPEFAYDFGPFTKVGAYADVRLRDGGTPLRPFYPSDSAWLHQGYVWAYADPGVLKAGAIWRRFGLDWDGSWWGNVQYFDGFKFAYDWGVSWEVTPEMQDGFKVDRFFQFFFHNYLDGSLVGADPNSVIGSSERNTAVARVVPTVQLSKDETLALGFSGMIGQIDNRRALSLVGIPLTFPSPGDQVLAAWALDATYTRGKLKLFIEGMQSYGVLSPSQYVSFGPSDRITDMLAGFNWTHGPITYRFCYSLGLDDNPSGTQHLFVPGVTVALTRNVEFYLEYVRQEVRHNGTEQFTTLENGMQLLLHWHF